VSSACIDTHALVWHLTRPKRLGRKAARFLREADRGRAVVNIPAIVGVELTMIAEAGRRSVSVAELDALLVAHPAFRVLPLDAEQLREFAALGAVGDPFDRMIVAAARVCRQPLLTADGDIADTELVRVIWD
jgi:PIN domain nuclease of toxin-antitoxin system